MRLSDPEHVAEQYRDASRFDARVRIYELYDASSERWLPWLFARLDLAPGERVLELGCGTGNLWRENALRVPELGALVLSDLSPGMLEQTRARLAGAGLRPEPELRVEDAQSLALPDASFDVVVANHMLYHVPDRARALAEVRRVLRPGGRLLAATNHWTHLLELRELVSRFGIRTEMLLGLRDPGIFDLETAAEEIAAVLDVRGVERRTSALEIRAVEPLLDYVRSMVPGAGPDPAALAALGRHVARQIELMGAFHVGIAAGAVRAVRA